MVKIHLYPSVVPQYDEENKLLLTAPNAQDLIIKDLILNSYSNPRCRRNHKSELILGSGGVLGSTQNKDSADQIFSD